MNFKIINDDFYDRIIDKINDYFPSFDSVFDNEDGAYPVLGELGTFIMENFHQKRIKTETIRFINDAIEYGGSETEDAIALQLFNKFYENIDLTKEIKVLLSGKSALVFDKYFIEYNKQN